MWQIMLLALAAAPISLLCNFLRIMCWGLIAIYTRPDPVNPGPRAIPSRAPADGATSPGGGDPTNKCPATSPARVAR